MDAVKVNDELKSTGVISLKHLSLVFVAGSKGNIKIDICPFCYSMYVFPQEVINTKAHACLCGARFSSLGLASKTADNKEVV